MKHYLVALILILCPLTSFGQVDCSLYNESKEATKALPEESLMKGCKSFNELVAARGIEILDAPIVKSYGCFAVDLPHESEDLFIFVQIGEDIDNDDKTKANGFGSLKTFHKGLKINEGFAEFNWRQYPKDHSALWTPGIWLGDGKAQTVSLGSDGTMTPDPNSDDIMRKGHLPQLEVSVDNDTVRFTLALNNEKNTLEMLSFNRFTGKAITSINSGAWRCIQAVVPSSKR